MIVLVDYGLGNLQAFANIYKRLGIEARPARTADELREGSHIILPGVGAFDWAMTRLAESGMREALDERVLEDKIPVLGVCVGMQIMARRSDEGVQPGLGWIDAEVVKFDTELFSGRTHLPHMGWNDVEPTTDDTLFHGIDSPRYYFLHSYYMAPTDPAKTLAAANYGLEFTAAVRSNNVYGTQFHPEKSHAWGVDLLRNFATL